jgi:hypothetical protein
MFLRQQRERNAADSEEPEIKHLIKGSPLYQLVQQ